MNFRTVAKYYKVIYHEYMQEFYTTRQIAKMLSVKTITIRRWIAKGELPAVFLEKEYRIIKSDFDKFIQNRKVQIKKGKVK